MSEKKAVFITSDLSYGDFDGMKKMYQARAEKVLGTWVVGGGGGWENPENSALLVDRRCATGHGQDVLDALEPEEIDFLVVYAKRDVGPGKEILRLMRKLDHSRIVILACSCFRPDLAREFGGFEVGEWKDCTWLPCECSGKDTTMALYAHFLQFGQIVPRWWSEVHSAESAESLATESPKS